jgi:hypothetical protein
MSWRRCAQSGSGPIKTTCSTAPSRPRPSLKTTPAGVPTVPHVSTQSSQSAHVSTQSTPSGSPGVRAPARAAERRCRRAPRRAVARRRPPSLRPTGYSEYSHWYSECSRRYSEYSRRVLGVLTPVLGVLPSVLGVLTRGALSATAAGVVWDASWVLGGTHVGTHGYSLPGDSVPPTVSPANRVRPSCVKARLAVREHLCVPVGAW